MTKKRKTKKQKIKKSEKQEKRKIQENNVRQKLSQEHTSSVNKNARDDNNKWKSILFKAIKWIIVAILLPIIPVIVEYILPILSKNFSPVVPSLDTSRSSICTTDINYYTKIPGDTTDKYYIILPTGQTGYISINLTNNDQSTLVVNDIYLDVVDFQPIKDILQPERIWGGNYSDPVYYGVKLENLCKEYKCMRLDRESASYFWTHYELPAETKLKIIGEQIEFNKTDEIEIIFSPQYSGKYRFKIIIDYSIRSFNNRIESDEFDFISLNPGSTS